MVIRTMRAMGTRRKIRIDPLRAAGTKKYLGIGYDFENSVLDMYGAVDSQSPSISHVSDSLAQEVPSLPIIQNWITTARVHFVREMAYALVEAAIESHDTAEWDTLGQAVVDWASTLEIEADKRLRRRMTRRRVQREYAS